MATMAGLESVGTQVEFSAHQATVTIEVVPKLTCCTFV